MRGDRAQGTLIGLLVATVVVTTMLLAGVSISTAVIDQQTTRGSALDGPCVRGPDGTCVDPTIRRLPIGEQPHRVRLRAGVHLVGISPQGARPVTALRIDGQTELSDPGGLDGVYRITVAATGPHTLTTDGGDGVIRLRAGVR